MATREQIKSLQFFSWEEFKNPGMMHFPLLRWLDLIRARYGRPLVITSDGRTSVPPGGSPTSLHLVGRAVDLRWPKDGALLARLTETILDTPRPPGEGGYQLGLEPGAIAGAHIHLGLFPGFKKESVIFIT